VEVEMEEEEAEEWRAARSGTRQIVGAEDGVNFFKIFTRGSLVWSIEAI